MNPMESKNIKDYLHLYLGQLATLSNLSQRMIVYGWEDGQAKINGYLIDCLEKENSFTIKPILRPLSDMTIEEGAWCLKAVFFDHLEYPIRDFKLELVGEEKKNPRISIDNDWFINSLTFGNKTGSIWSAEYPSRNVKIPASVFAYLLSKGFDLFGLIEAGLAIKKSQ